MASLNEKKRDTLYEYFQAGDRPNQDHFEQLIDSFLNKADDDVYVMEVEEDHKNLGIGVVEPEAKLHVGGLVAEEEVGLIVDGKLKSNHAEGGLWLDDQEEGMVGSSDDGGIGFWTKNTAWAALFLKKDDGNVGIGTATPSQKLHIYNENELQTWALIESTHNDSGLSIRSGATDWSLRNNQADASLRFHFRDTSGQKNKDVVTLGQEGNVGIGVANPQAYLHLPSGAGVTLQGTSGSLIIGDPAGLHLAMDKGEIMAKKNEKGVSVLTLQKEKGLTSIGGDLEVKGHINQENWISASLNKGYSNPKAGESFNDAGYYKDKSGRVYLKGSVKGSGKNNIVFTLPDQPVNYRPPNTTVFCAIYGTSFTRVEITAKGEVIIMQPSTSKGTAYTSLDGISFRAGAASTKMTQPKQKIR